MRSVRSARSSPRRRARVTSWSPRKRAPRREPFHGYFFKILTRQGKSAPGGKYDYIINGNMIGGFALVAWPAEYGESGIMTFIVNQQGRVYQKDLGPKTAKAAAGDEGIRPGQDLEPCRRTKTMKPSFPSASSPPGLRSRWRWRGISSRPRRRWTRKPRGRASGPRTGHTVTLHLPQVERWTSNWFSARAAVEVKPAEAKKDLLGVVWFEAHGSVDRTNRLVTLDRLEITKARFPEAPDNGSNALAIVREVLPSGARTVSLDYLITALGFEQAAARRGAARTQAHAAGDHLGHEPHGARPR